MSDNSLTVWSVVAIIATILGSLALSVVPVGAGQDAAYWPKLTVAVVYFWLIHRPAGMPTFAVLAVGVILDMIGGGVVGAGALPLLVAGAAVRPFAGTLSFSPFTLRCLVFAGFAGFFFLGEWALTGLAHLSMPPINAPLAQFFVTVFSYLIVSVFFRRVIRIGRT